MTQYKELYKLVLLGESYSGKSAIAMRLSEGIYNKHYVQTIGLDYHSHIIRLDNCDDVKIQFWDTGGNKNYLPIITSYISGVAGGIFTIDLTSLTSINNIEFWIKKFNSLNNKKVPKLLVGTKSDSENRVITTEEAKETADKFGCEYMECSAKKDENIYEIFKYITEKINENSKNNITCGIERNFITEIEVEDTEIPCLQCVIS